MKIDVSIEYDPKLSEVTIISKAAQITETRTARLGLSRPKHENLDAEQIEFVGEDWEIIKKIEDWFPNDPTRKDRILRIINPLESSEFEPYRAFRMIQHFIRRTEHRIYPKTWLWRKFIPFLDSNEIKLKILGYSLFNPEKKVEFEKLLNREYKHVTFIS